MIGKKWLKLMSLATMLFLSSSGYAASSVTCREVVQAGEKAIQAQKAQIQTRDAELSQYALMTKAQADQLSAANAKLGAWYRSPYLYLFLGLGAGLYLGKK